MNKAIYNQKHMIESLCRGHYLALLEAVKFLVLSVGGAIDVLFLYRFIDSDNKPDIWRIKKLFIEDGLLNIVYDTWTGETPAADVAASYDEDFDDEETLTNECPLPEESVGMNSICMLNEIHTELLYYTIPRIQKEKKELK